MLSYKCNRVNCARSVRGRTVGGTTRLRLAPPGAEGLAVLKLSFVYEFTNCAKSAGPDLGW